MSLKNDRDIEKLFRLADKQAKQLGALEQKANHYAMENEWLKNQIKTGLRDVILRVVQDEVEVEMTDKTTDEQLKELMG